MRYIAKTENETKRIAQKLALKLKGGEIIALEGDLGAGKTTLTQYLGQALAVKANMASPTFVLMKVYNVSKKNIQNFVHVDCYRLDDPQELFYLGLEEYLNNLNSIVVIEWADKIKNYLAKYKKVFWLKIQTDKQSRIIKIN